MQFNLNDKINMAGGTVFSIIPNIPTNDFIVTVIMAFTGAFISFIASLLFKYLAKLLKKKK